MTIIIVIIIAIWLLLLFLIAAKNPWAGLGFFVWTVAFPIMLFLKHGG